MLQRPLHNIPRVPAPTFSPPFSQTCTGRQSPPAPSNTATAFSRYEAVQVISVRSPSGDCEDTPLLQLQGKRATWAASSNGSEGGPLDPSLAPTSGPQKEQPKLVRIRLSVEYRVRCLGLHEFTTCLCLLKASLLSHGRAC